MRFDLLFDDLEGQLESQLAGEAAQQRAEEERLRAARTSLRDRLACLAGPAGGGIRLHLSDGSAVELALRTVGRDWLSGELPGGEECVVPLAAVAGASLGYEQRRASRARIPEPEPRNGKLAAKVGIGVVLRGLARRRVPVDVVTASEPGALHGTLDRVGADHLDLAVHERGAARRESAVIELRIVPFVALVLLRV